MFRATSADEKVLTIRTVVDRLVFLCPLAVVVFPRTFILPPVMDRFLMRRPTSAESTIRSTSVDQIWIHWAAATSLDSLEVKDHLLVLCQERKEEA